MGARPSKLRLFYRKAIRNKKGGATVGGRRVGRMDSTAQLLNGREGEGEGHEEGGGGEEVMLLDVWPSAGAEEQSKFEDGERERAVTQETLDELEQMQREMDSVVGAMRTQLERLENEQRRKLQICSKKWRNSLLFDATDGAGIRKKKLESMAEECRLRNALLVDKFRNCKEYLQGFDALIRSIQRDQQKNEDDDFLREFLLKTAKRQHRKGQLSQAVDTFCQLLIATDGRLRGDEMAVLADVCREKVEHTREFHERISGVVRQQMDNSPFVVDELWGSVLEELRAECADAYEIVMRVRPSGQEEEEGEGPEGGQKQNVEQLKYLLGSTICALWLQITPYGHEEFDEVKELFFRTLDQYMKTFRQGNCPVERNGSGISGMDLEKTVRELLGQCPKLAGTKKMRKIAQRLFCASGKANGGTTAPDGQPPQQQQIILVEY